MSEYIGIDYGLGKTNINIATGIRYGVISANRVAQVWYDEAEADYGEPTCRRCGNEAKDSAEHKDDDLADKDYFCPECKESFWSDEAFGDEPHGWYFDSDAYKAVSCLDSDVMVIKSPHYMLAQFCSPCVPGAGNLQTECADGPRTYCFGHDWFDDGKAPYRVFDVLTGEEVFSRE